MSNPRISLALSADGALPEGGTLLVIGARPGDDLTAVPKARAIVVQGFRPDHDALAAQGWRVVPETNRAGDGFAATLILMPRSRAQARDWVAEAGRRVVRGGPVWIDGQKTDGIEAMLKDIRARCPVTDSLSKTHGRIFRCAAADLFTDWAAQALHPAPGFTTRPGVFSADRIDPGSALLAEALPDDLKGRVADLGAGWGWLSARILDRAGVTELHLVEADHAALSCAEANVADPRARFHWADATRFRPGAPFDAVVSNPPFHTGRAAEPALGAAFIAAAAGMLTPAGRFFMVANRHLPYEAVLTESFGSVRTVAQRDGFKIIEAVKAMPVKPERAPKPFDRVAERNRHR